MHDELGHRGIFSWYEHVDAWDAKLQACAAVILLVTRRTHRSELVETQVSRALELGKPLMMLYGDDFRETRSPLPGLRVLFDRACRCPKGGTCISATSYRSLYTPSRET